MTWITRQSLPAVLTALAVAAGWLLIFPGGVIKDEEISRTAADYSMDTGPVGEVAAIQEFVPRYDRIRSLGVDIGKLDGRAGQGTLYLHFYDENLQEFAVVPYDISEMRDGELTDIPVNLKLQAGSRYYVSILCEDYGEAAPVVHYRSLSGNGPAENLHFYYGPTVIDDASANIRFTYQKPLHPVQILFYDSLILLAGAALISLTGKKKDRKEHEPYAG